MRSTLLTLAVLAGLFFAFRGTAQATLRVCDASGEPVSVAIAVLTPSAGGVQSQSEGWFQIDSGTCQLVIDTDLDAATRYYLFAKSTTIAWAGTSRKTTDASFCTNFADRFNYVNRGGNLCTGAGEQMEWFINEPIAGPTWTIDLDIP